MGAALGSLYSDMIITGSQEWFFCCDPRPRQKEPDETFLEKIKSLLPLRWSYQAVK
jgi:hypothetical protein